MYYKLANDFLYIRLVQMSINLELRSESLSAHKLFLEDAESGLSSGGQFFKQIYGCIDYK